MKRLSIIVLLGFLGAASFGQNPLEDLTDKVGDVKKTARRVKFAAKVLKPKKWRAFIGFDSKTSFMDENTFVKGLNLGMRLNNKYKFGLGYYSLDGEVHSDNFPIAEAVTSSARTYTDLRYITSMFEPLFKASRKLMFSTPVHIGASFLERDFWKTGVGREVFSQKWDVMAELGAMANYRVIPFVHLGLGVNYRYISSTEDIVKDLFNKPVFQFKLKIGRNPLK